MVIHDWFERYRDVTRCTEDLEVRMAGIGGLGNMMSVEEGIVRGVSV